MQTYPTIRKVPVDSVPFGQGVCTRGTSVWAAYDGDRLVCIGATAKEARELYRRASSGTYGRPPITYPSDLDGRRDRPMSLEEAERIEKIEKAFADKRWAKGR